MSFRKHIAGVAATAVVASAFAMAAPANAVTDPDDPSFVPVAADLIGVGSDTSQHALHLLAENGWNAQVPAPTFKVASFSATGGGNITLPSGDVTRPNGSGAGKNLLHSTGNNTDVDFARSSSTLSAGEKTDGLQQFPFALDTLKMAVSNNVASNAPTSLTPTQIVNIYKCDPTADDWSELGGSAGTIAPRIPQAGSGTRSFFTAQLTAMNGGSAVTLGGCVVEVQEHDDTLIKSDPNAVAPFSEGRAGLLGTTLRLLDGWKADRALYNVVRGTDLANADIQAVFGEAGFVCSNEARALIEQAGFKQLARSGNGGVCGVSTQDATTNFTLNQQVTTTTVLTATAPSAGAVHLSAAVTASTSPSGTVQFFEGETSLGTVPLSQGAATLDLASQSVGGHTYTAKFTGDTAVQDASQDDATVIVKSASSIVLSFPAASYGKSTLITATTTGIADGQTVSIKVGTMAAKNAVVTANKATITLPATTAAKTYSVVATYAGNAEVAGSTATKSLVIAKATPVISETFPTATLVGKPGKGVVKVAIAGSTVKPTGTVKIFMGTKLLKQVTLTNGQVTVTLPKQALGKHTLTIKYLGSTNVKAGSKSFTITQK
jgi:hypothetical protein